LKSACATPCLLCSSCVGKRSTKKCSTDCAAKGIFRNGDATSSASITRPALCRLMSGRHKTKASDRAPLQQIHVCAFRIISTRASLRISSLAHRPHACARSHRASQTTSAAYAPRYKRSASAGTSTASIAPSWKCPRRRTTIRSHSPQPAPPSLNVIGATQIPHMRRQSSRRSLFAQEDIAGMRLEHRSTWRGTTEANRRLPSTAPRIFYTPISVVVRTQENDDPGSQPGFRQSQPCQPYLVFSSTSTTSNGLSPMFSGKCFPPGSNMESPAFTVAS
jgi:hypothetical protein